MQSHYVEKIIVVYFVLLLLFVFFFIGLLYIICFFFFFQAEDGIRDYKVTGVQTCALPISNGWRHGGCDARGRSTSCLPRSTRRACGRRLDCAAARALPKRPAQRSVRSSFGSYTKSFCSCSAMNDFDPLTVFVGGCRSLSRRSPGSSARFIFRRR